MSKSRRHNRHRRLNRDSYHRPQRDFRRFPNRSKVLRDFNVDNRFRLDNPVDNSSYRPDWRFSARTLARTRSPPPPVSRMAPYRAIPDRVYFQNPVFRNECVRRRDRRRALFSQRIIGHGKGGPKNRTLGPLSHLHCK